MSQIHIDHIYTPTTKDQRTLRIYLPEGYDYDDMTRYPVLYMHDAQNLFDDHLAFGGVSWGIKDTLDDLIQKKFIPKLIVVGIDNSPIRLDEYTPWKSAELVDELFGKVGGGKGDIYADFIVKDLKHYIDAHYKTKTDYDNTMIAGSSLGGLISSYIAFKYTDLFGVVGVFSLASWFNEVRYLSYLDQAPLKSDQKYFITIGKHESSKKDYKGFSNIYLDNSRNLRNALKDKGVTHIFYQETDDAHNEKNWKKAFKSFILFAFDKNK
ncbi:MAG: alpha/beta hydrolase [Acholeplasmataceae bacterium]